MSPSTHTCALGGRVVAARHAVPDAAFDLDFEGPTVGCNHLRCSRCDQPVRQAPGLSWGATADRLAASADWEALADAGVLTRNPEHRLYACACRVHVEDHDRALGDAEQWDHDEVPPPWRCAGHPGLTLPLALDGVALDTVRDVVDAFVRHAGSPPAAAPAFTRETPTAWSQRLVHVLYPRPDGLLDALADLLDADNPVARAAVSDLYRTTPTLPGAERLADSLVDHPERWFDQPNPLSPADGLDRWAQVAVARRAVWTDPLGSPLDEGAIEAVRHLALHAPSLTISLLQAIARLDPAWLATHAGRIVENTDSEDVARRILYTLRRKPPEAATAAVAMLDAWPGDPEDYRRLAAELVPAVVLPG